MTSLAPAHAAPHPRTGASRGKLAQFWQRWRRVVIGAFAVLVVCLLAMHARDVDWAGAWRALRAQPPQTLALAASLAAASHALYGSFDLFGRRYTGHNVPKRVTWATTFVSYAFNLNLGSLVGAVAMRFRLYSRYGLDAGTIGRVLGMALLTNWIGYAAWAGVLFAIGAVDLPRGVPLHGIGLRVLGYALCAAVLAYVAACGCSSRRTWTIRGHELTLPSLPMALTQLVASMVNWALIAGVIYLLLGRHVAYTTVLGVLMAAAVAGVVTHVPAGLGVIEAVFLSLLAGARPQGEVLGALLAYRGVYYLLPLGIALVVYAVLERGAKRAAPARSEVKR